MNTHLIKLSSLNRRKHRLVEKLDYNNVSIEKGFITDGASVPKTFILGVCIGVLSLDIVNVIHIPVWCSLFLLFLVFIVGVYESNGWFMQPAILHDYRFHNASTRFGWWKANVEYLHLMLDKTKEQPTERNALYRAWNILVGVLVALIHFIGLTAFSWWTWNKCLVKNTNKRKEL